ncbi:MAG: alanine--tRNA ligase [Gammaproteobacteria bacterium]|nr:MAG: alanine--tRNA ligase [Gammaproteobacteria bacterium]
MKTTAELRQLFLDFFESKGHLKIPSASLVPVGDQTLLFTNAGMVPFKDYFLGKATPPAVRATSAQRCVRAGGKHNDLENVGHTARHHTFFEMLGNFSFGDYFKREAISYSWEFLTRVLNLPEEKLWITVFEEDDEAADIWLQEIGISPDRFSRIGAHDNFWAMGNTGPCGPCSEIFYDHGESVPGGPPGTPEEDGDRYVEIWNLVFMQYDRDETGEKHPLPKPSVDTGMGLERLAAVMQGVHDNYQIDLFQGLIKAAARICNVSGDTIPASLKVIADHIRSCAFLMVDGILPSNEGRGYVLRRIIRRAIRHGYQLGVKDEPFFYKMVAPLVEQMGAAYPELVAAADRVEKQLRQEEERFSETLDQGMSILNRCIHDLDGTVIPGEIVFKLYDTYGFPVDLTADVAREHDLTLDMQGFEDAMAEQKARARAASSFTTGHVPVLPEEYQTNFTGYQELETPDCTVIAIFRNQEEVDSLQAGEEGVILLDRSPFYAESGGQVGDQGTLRCGNDLIFQVNDTQKWGKTHAHIGTLEHGEIHKGLQLLATVANSERASIARHHSATHLVHAALRRVLGEHVTQKGSLVDAERLRFDFSHSAPLSFDEVQKVQRLVNEQIILNLPVETAIMSYDEAIQTGAMALFGEKYGDQVRVLKMGAFSTELCGGTHVSKTGDIGYFRIISEGGVASGIRRIEAVAGPPALDILEEESRLLEGLGSLLKVQKRLLPERVEQLLEKNRELEKKLAQLQQGKASEQMNTLAEKAQNISGIKVLAEALTGADVKTMRGMMDGLRDKLAPAVIVLGSCAEDKVTLIAGVSKDLNPKIKAGELMGKLAPLVGGKGGGRPDMAQGGGNQPENLSSALDFVVDWVKQQV